MIPLIKNSARTTLAVGVNAGAGALSVLDGSIFPAPSPTALSGTILSATYVVNGTGTAFTTELQRFDPVWAVVNGQVEARYVIHIESDTKLYIDRPFSAAIVAPTALTQGNVLFLTLVEGISHLEHVACTNIVGDTLTVYRGQDGSTAGMFSAGAVVEGRITKALIETAVSRAVWDAFALMQDSSLTALIGVDVPGLVADDIAEALLELYTLITDHVNDAEDAHDATAISFAQVGWAASDVAAAILEAYADAIIALNAHAAAAPAHAATQITFSPYGPLSAGTVQAAIEELADIAATSGVEKIKDAVETSGLVWDANDDFLLSKAIGRYVHFSDYYVDSGTANAKVLSPIGDFRVPPAGYTNGMRVRFKVNATNTAATTVNIGGLGLKNIVRRNGASLQKWDLVEDDEVEIVFEEALDAFVLPNVYSGQILAYGVATTTFSLVAGASTATYTTKFPGADAHVDVEITGTLSSDIAVSLPTSYYHAEIHESTGGSANVYSYFTPSRVAFSSFNWSVVMGGNTIDAVEARHGIISTTASTISASIDPDTASISGMIRVLVTEYRK